MAIAPIEPGDTDARAKMNLVIAKANEVDGKASVAQLAAETAARQAAILALPLPMPVQHRPGDAPLDFGQALPEGEVMAAPLAEALLRYDDAGKVVRLAGDNLVAPRHLYAVESGRRYLATFVVQRRVNSPDPDNDAIRCALAWYGQGKGRLVSTPQTIAQDLLGLTTGSGRQVVRAVVSRAAGADIDIVAPAGARYVRPYVETFGTLVQSDVEVINWLDITDAQAFAPDVSALEDRVGALESLDPGDRLTNLESQVTAPNDYRVATIGDLEAATVPVTADTVDLLGYYGTADGGGGRLLSVPGGTVGAGVFTSIDSRKWKVQTDFVRLEQLGAIGGDVVKDTDALLKAIEIGAPVQLESREYLIAPIPISGDLTIIGRGKRSAVKWQDGGDPESLLDFFGAVIDADLRHFVVDSNRQGYTDTSGYFAAIDFRADAGSSLTLDGVMFKNGRIIDVRVPGPTADGEFIDFHMSGCQFKDGMVGTASRSAAFVQCQDNVRATWANNAVAQPTLPATYGRAGFLFQRGAGSPTTSAGTLVATGNRFFNVGRGTADTLGCLDVYSGANVVAVSGNILENVPGRGISVKGDQSSISIVGNVVKNTKSSVAAVATPIVLFQDLFDSEVDRDIVIASNTISGSDGYGVFADGEGVSSARFRNALLSGNVISAVALDGIRARFINGVAIRANRIDGCGANGIAMSDADDSAVIEHNDIRDVASHGIDCNTALSDVDLVIRGNRIRSLTGGSSRGISVGASCRSYQIDDNDVEGGAIGVVTAGSTALSSIRRNRITSAAPISRSGSDALLIFEDNLTTNAMGFTIRELTISAGVITAWADWHWVDTEGDAATDDLDTINGGFEGRIIRLRAANSGRTVVLKDGTGNLRLGGDRALDNAEDCITLQFSGGVWVETAFANNGA